MEIIKKFNPLTGTYEYYNIITPEWVGESQSGHGIFDSLVSIASKVASKATSDTTKSLAKESAKSVAKTTAKQALESASKKPVMNWVNTMLIGSKVLRADPSRLDL